MSHSLHLYVSQETRDGTSYRITRLEEDGRSDIEIFYHFDRLMPWSENTVWDGHVLAILLYAASRRKSLHVHGPVSGRMARHLEELLHVWSLWRPKRYQKISLQFDQIIHQNVHRFPHKAISAFSGGADATFLALRHTKILPEPLRYPLTDVLMVHGFDISLENKEHFDQLVARTQPLLQELSLPLRVIRTNSKALNLQDWEDSFGLQLAACLQMFSEEFSYALIGSSNPYDTLTFPIGSSPVFDYLMSGDQMTLVHDGAGFGRTDKIAAIAAYPTACRSLKVCWIGEKQSENCGVCEKCTRTRMNFLAAGVENPACFSGKLDIKKISHIPVFNTPQMNELKTIAAYAQKHQIKGLWLTLLDKRIAAGLTRTRAERLKARLDSMGLRKPAKKIWNMSKKIAGRA